MSVIKTIKFEGFDFTLEIRPDERTIISVDIDNKVELRYLVQRLGIGLTFRMWEDRRGYHAWALISNGAQAADSLRILGFPIPMDKDRQDAINIDLVRNMLGLTEQDIININHLLS